MLRLKQDPQDSRALGKRYEREQKEGLLNWRCGAVWPPALFHDLQISVILGSEAGGMGELFPSLEFKKVI